MDDLAREGEEFLRQLRLGLSALPREERDEIVDEIRSHLRDRAAAGKPLLAGFDDPHTYASRFVSENALRGALAQGTSLELGRALLTGARTGLVTLLAVAPLAVAQLLGAALVVIGALKPFAPSHVGYFVDGEGRFLALGLQGFNSIGQHEVLGYWAMPLFLVAGVLLVWASNRLLRALARLRLKSAQMP